MIFCGKTRLRQGESNNTCIYLDCVKCDIQTNIEPHAFSKNYFPFEANIRQKANLNFVSKRPGQSTKNKVTDIFNGMICKYFNLQMTLTMEPVIVVIVLTLFKSYY